MKSQHPKRPSWLRTALLVAVGLGSFVAVYWATTAWEAHRMQRFRQEQYRQTYHRAKAELATAEQEFERFYALPDAALSSFELGHYSDADAYARELLALVPRYRQDWNYGNAVHDGHVVLGRLALQAGDREAAIQHLSAAAQTPGSPQLNSFGPNMTLARDLLLAGEEGAVRRYFEQVEAFWDMGRGRLNEWRAAVDAGEIPDFGSNLLY